MNEQAALAATIATIEGRRDEIVATLASLVRVPSINPNYPRFEGVPAAEGGEMAANGILRAVYESAGCDIAWVEAVAGRANLVGVRRGLGGGRSLIFNGHVDTVAPGEPANWTSGDPFDGRVEDGFLFGLGASDMKAGLVAQAWAARAIDLAGVRLRGDLVLQSVVGEEMMEHESGTSAVVAAGYTADAAVVSEPTSMGGPPMLATCSGGATVFTIRIEGRAVHSCARGSHIWPGGTGEHYGVNAIDKAFQVTQAIRKLEQDWSLARRHPLFPPGFFTIGPNTFSGTLHGQTLSWAVANSATLEYMAMYEPERSQAEVRGEIEEALGRVFDADPWLREHRPTIEWPHTWEPYATEPDHPIAQALADGHMAALEAPVGRQAFLAVDDATFLNRAGIPSITYGPGSLLTCHCFDEHVPVGDLIRACRVYAATAIRWCGVA